MPSPPSDSSSPPSPEGGPVPNPPPVPGVDPLAFLATEARALYLGAGWRLFLARLEEMYRAACDLAVSHALDDPHRALAYLHRALGYRQLLGHDFARESLATPPTGGGGLDTPHNPVVSHSMPLDSEGRRLRDRKATS